MLAFSILSIQLVEPFSIFISVVPFVADMHSMSKFATLFDGTAMIILTVKSVGTLALVESFTDLLKGPVMSRCILIERESPLSYPVF